MMRHQSLKAEPPTEHVGKRKAGLVVEPVDWDLQEVGSVSSSATDSLCGFGQII